MGPGAGSGDGCRISGDKSAVKALVSAMFGDDPELRKRAADVARRIAERDAAPLERFADELAGLLAEVPVEESRTRWHLGLVVARVAHTREQRLRAARLMELLMEDESNVARCSAVEGIALLACQEVVAARGGGGDDRTGAAGGDTGDEVSGAGGEAAVGKGIEGARRNLKRHRSFGINGLIGRTPMG